ncbi:MAG TPA: ATP-dependent sacrificial sulfur transferase LarE [Candidatus Syntrophoarchaeum butanivorans]|uniref:ATP-dependent sacrificial sulfur transferase LarE n=1 Tax=Candidatus Syntropharchaeum butanivorans TaxID=1839936 RepID=A0A7C0X3S9_9EURY|nr:ATP-dependent sacrificial sulfur transferase LarE [Candidatus Syntrophoarchaeum butanivorans]
MSYLDKLERLKELIRSKKQLIVSFSGGVDSTLLLKVSYDLLGDHVLGVIVKSEVFPRAALESAVDFVRKEGIRYEVSELTLLDDPLFSSNPKKRCYHCKKHHIRLIKSIAGQYGVDTIADGLNLSDLGEYRPGLLASDEEGVWHPFVEAGIRKEDIRDIARDIGLDLWDKPSDSCLATRIPYGERITEENLRMVERGESALKKMGFRHIRLRLHRDIGRIEVTGEDFERVLEYRGEITSRLKEIGIKYITLDLEGYRSGSMDGVL